MRAWHIAALVAEPATEDEIRREADAFYRTLIQLETGDPGRPLILPKTLDTRRQLAAIRERWNDEMLPAIALAVARHSEAVRDAQIAAYLQRTGEFVTQIDALVLAVEQRSRTQHDAPALAAVRSRGDERRR